MRFLHTADWQIGMKAAHVGDVGARVRAERLSAAHRAVDVARRSGAEFILVAGDTFEDNGVDRVLVQQVADILMGFGRDVYVISGNHDPVEPGSVWEHPVWRSADRIHVLRDSEALSVPGGILYPCPLRDKYSRKDPTSWIEKDDGRTIRVGIAHGTVEGIQQDEPDHPIPRDAASRSGLDYLALGHWHSTATFPESEGKVRMAYSGTHEATRFGERDSGNALIVDISSPGAPPHIEPVRTGGLRWLIADEELREPDDLRRLRERIEQMENAASTLIELRLKGLLYAKDSAELERIREIIPSRFLFGRIEDAGIRLSPEDEAWLYDLPAGIVREVAMRLQNWSDPSFPGNRPLGATPVVAARSFLELYAIFLELRHDPSVALR